MAPRPSLPSVPKTGGGSGKTSPRRRSLSATQRRSALDVQDRDLFQRSSFRGIKQGIKDRFHEAKRRESMDGSASATVAKAVDTFNAQQIANDLAISVDDVLLVRDIFNSFDDDGNGVLDEGEFQQAVMKLLQSHLRDQSLAAERVKSMTSEWYWWEKDTGKSTRYKPSTITFEQFLKWYSSNGFHEDLLLSESQRWVRRIAKRHGVSPDYVEGIHRLFSSYDNDKSGTVDISEFKQVLHEILKVPANSELPMSRVQYFWLEIDTDRSGKVVFEEFLAWWLKYFDETSCCNLKQTPFEHFYKQVRRIGTPYLDPPAYAKAKERWDEL